MMFLFVLLPHNNSAMAVLDNSRPQKAPTTAAATTTEHWPSKKEREKGQNRILEELKAE